MLRSLFYGSVVLTLFIFSILVVASMQRPDSLHAARGLSLPDGTGKTDRTFPVDVVESESEIVVRCGLPGVHRDHIEVSLDDDALLIRNRLEPFYRWINLPARIDGTRVEAFLKNGVLTVHLPKALQAKKCTTSFHVNDAVQY